MKIGTVVKTNRREMRILVLWDGAEKPEAYGHDDCVNPRPDATDMLDGRGLLVGDRVESVQTPNGWKLRWTGERFAADPDPAPTVDKGIETAEQWMAHAKRLKPGDRLDAWLSTNHLPLDPDELDGLL